MRKFTIFLSFILSFALFLTTKTTFVEVKAETNNDLNIPVKSALLFDANSQELIYSKDADKKYPIASMTKLASLLIVFDEINKQNILLDEKIKVSSYAAQTEGSSAFLDEGSEYLVSDLIKTVIISSANDSTVALAERVAGSEYEFVKLMNKKVEELGLKNTNFINSTGLPALDHYSTAEEIAKIYMLIYKNPIYKEYSKVWMTELIHPSGRKTEIVNTNRLIKSYNGCESGKTGYTNDAGYCLVSSAKRADMDLIGVVMGAENSKDRFNAMCNLFDYGFNNFYNKVLVSKEDVVAKLKVVNSLVKEIDVYSKNDIVKFLKRGEDFKFSVDYRLSRNKAPLKKDEVVGMLYVLDNKNIIIFESELIVKDDVDSLRLKDVLNKIYNQM